jgi:hypothetical protein
MELLNETSPSSQETHDSPFCLRKQSHDSRKSTSFMSGMPVFRCVCLLRGNKVWGQESFGMLLASTQEA